MTVSYEIKRLNNENTLSKNRLHDLIIYDIKKRCSNGSSMDLICAQSKIDRSVMSKVYNRHRAPTQDFIEKYVRWLEIYEEG